MPKTPEKPALEANVHKIAATLSQNSDFVINNARNLANSLLNGDHLHRRAGSGDEFFQYRPYSNGESVSSIDWRQSAKSDNAFVKQKEQQSPRNIGIFTLHNKRTDWSSAENLLTKAAIGNICALAIGYTLLEMGENIIVSGQDKSTKSKDKFTENLIALNMELPTFFKRGTSVLFHDGLCDIAKFRDMLSNATAANCRLILVFLEDNGEKNFDFKGRIEFSGIENNQKILIENCDDVRNQFIKNYNDHFSAIENLAKEYSYKTFYINNNNELSTQLIPVWQEILEGEEFD